MAAHFLTELTDDQIKQHVEMSHALWSGGRSVEDRLRQLNYWRKAGTGIRLSGVIDESGNLLSALKRYSLCFQSAQGLAQGIGLGAIFTREDARKRGLAAQLIHEVLREEAARGCEYSLLFSDIGSSYYAQFGFQALPVKNFTSQVPPAPTTLCSLSLEPVEEANFAEILKLRAQFSYGGFRLKLDTQQWSLFTALNRVHGTWFITRSNTRLGVLSLSFDKNYIWVEDLCIGGEFQAEALVLLQSIAQENGQAEIKGWWPVNLNSDEVQLSVRERPLPMIAHLKSPGSLTERELAEMHFASLEHF